MTDREAMRKVAEELRKGAKMLSFSCPICNFPALKDKKTGIVYCASCQREIKFAESKDEYQVADKAEGKLPDRTATEKKAEVKSDSFPQSEGNLYKKFKYMCEMKLEDLYTIIEKTDNVDILKKQFTLVNSILETAYMLDKFFLSDPKE